MPPHPLTNFEIQKYYQNERKVNNVYSRTNLPKIKDEAFVIKLDEFKSIGTHWIALYMNDIFNATYFDSFGVEHISKEMKKVIGNKYIMKNIYRIQINNDSIVCGYFCIGFIDFMLTSKSLLGYTNLLSPKEYEQNDKIMLTHFH